MKDKTIANLKAELQIISRARYDSAHDFDAQSLKYTAGLIIKNRAGGKLLELGSGEGLLTKNLTKTFAVTAVDGSAKGIKRLKSRLGPRVKTRVALFEQLQLSETYSDIVLSHVLEHVQDPAALLRQAKSYLAPGGKIHIIVPHGHSLHRLLAAAVGALPSADSFTSADIKAGHRRVYLWKTLLYDIDKAGLTVIHGEGILLKPFPSPVMMYFGPTIINFTARLGKYFPRMAGEIYIVCSL